MKTSDERDADQRAEIAQLKAELEEAKKARAEMRDCFIDASALKCDCPHCLKIRHAFSTDCGKGYVSAEKVKVLVKALKACDTYLAGASQPPNRALIKQALAAVKEAGL